MNDACRIRQCKICQNIGFLQICDSVLIYENTGERKPAFWYILPSESEYEDLTVTNPITDNKMN